MPSVSRLRTSPWTTRLLLSPPPVICGGQDAGAETGREDEWGGETGRKGARGRRGGFAAWLAEHRKSGEGPPRFAKVEREGKRGLARGPALRSGASGRRREAGAAAPGRLSGRYTCGCGAHLADPHVLHAEVGGLFRAHVYASLGDKLAEEPLESVLLARNRALRGEQRSRRRRNVREERAPAARR